MVVAILLHQLEAQNRRARHHQVEIDRKRLRDRSDPFHMDPEYFRLLYRLPPHLVLELINMLNNDIVPFSRCKIPVHLQILTALSFFARGSSQRGLGQYYLHALSQTTVSRIITTVAEALTRNAVLFIRFPQTTEERTNISNRFLRYNNIQGILGLIDCFVVKFIRPSENEEAFFHYRHGHSMNVQVICDDRYVIQNIRICPGSNNDRFIWNFSDVKQYIENIRVNEEIVRQEGYYYLLDDGGYTPSPILLTPVLQALVGSPEAAYTEDHIRTRCKVEQTFGILTNMWRCISRKRVLQYKPEKVATIITAAAVLHNFRRLNGQIPGILQPNVQLQRNNGQYDGSYNAGIEERNRLIRLHYN